MAQETINSEEANVFRILFPYAYQVATEAKALHSRFAYYTSASTAMKIIENKELWMRKATGMNDFREIDHGLECIESVLQADIGKRFTTVIEEIAPGLWQ